MVASTISRVSLRGSPTLSPPIAYPGNPISIVRSADSFLSTGSIPPCTIPNRAWVRSECVGAAALGCPAELAGVFPALWVIPSHVGAGLLARPAERSSVSVVLASRRRCAPGQLGAAVPTWPLLHGTSCLCSSKYVLFRPAQRQLHRRAHAARLRRIFRTFIKRHDDVCAKSDLRFGRGFRTEELCRPVQMGTECHAFLGQFAQLAQAEDLKSPRVGENRPIP